DLPKTVTGGTGGVAHTYSYDADNARFSRVSSNGETTFYAGGLYERRNTTNVYYVPSEEGVIAQVECQDVNPERRVVYLERNNLGSTIASLELIHAGSTVSVQRSDQAFDPYGNAVDMTRPALMPSSTP